MPFDASNPDQLQATIATATFAKCTFLLTPLCVLRVLGGSLEPVSDRWLRLDESRVSRIYLDLLA